MCLPADIMFMYPGGHMGSPLQLNNKLKDVVP